MDILTIARGLLSVSVVIWHSVGYHDQIPFFINIPGRVAVWIFFGISGYVICYGFITNKYNFSLGDIKNFYINRLLRIYPLFIFLGILVWATEFALIGSSPIQWASVPAEFFGFQFNQEYKLNGVFWTLGLELQFYLVAPILLLPIFNFSTNKFYRLLTVFTFYIFGLLVYIFAILKFGWTFDGRNIISNLSHFLTGIFGCIAVYGVFPKKRTLLLSLFSTVMLVIFSAWLYKYKSWLFWSPAGIVLVDVLIFSLIVLHSSAQTVSTALPTSLHKVLIFLGIISYGIYAWHAYIMKYLAIDFSKSLSHTFFVLIPTSLVVATISYYLIEKPFQKLKRIKK